MPAHSKAIIVSAANELYFPLAQDLVRSIRDKTFAVDFDIGLLDTGLSEADRIWLATKDVLVAKTGIDIEYPDRENRERAKPGFRTLTARLFMREYFPGYDVYMWLDADVWVQTTEAIGTMLASAAKSPAIHLCCELDHNYDTYFKSPIIWHIFRDWYLANYGEAIAEQMTLRPMLNAGVWAMAANAPLWGAWINLYTEALQRLDTTADKNFMADQLGLNILLYQKSMPYTLMPSNYNWLTFYALPMLNKETGLYVEPMPPHRPISQIHLTRPVKIQREKIECVGDGSVERPLTYSSSRG